MRRPDLYVVRALISALAIFLTNKANVVCSVQARLPGDVLRKDHVHLLGWKMVQLSTDIEVPLYLLVLITGAGLVVIMESVLLLINSCNVLFTLQQFLLFIFAAVLCCFWIVVGDLRCCPSLSVAGLLGQTLHLQVLSCGQEGGKILLSNVDLSYKYRKFNNKKKCQDRQTSHFSL